MTEIMPEIEKIFMSYDRVLYKLKLLGIKTKGDKEIAHNDLRKAISVMTKNTQYVDGNNKNQ